MRWWHTEHNYNNNKKKNNNNSLYFAWLLPCFCFPSCAIRSQFDCSLFCSVYCFLFCFVLFCFVLLSCCVLFDHPVCVACCCCCCILWPLPWRRRGNLQVWPRREIYMQSDIMLVCSVRFVFLYGLVIVGWLNCMLLWVNESMNQRVDVPFNSCANSWLTWIFIGWFLFVGEKWNETERRGNTCINMKAFCWLRWPWVIFFDW